MKIARAIILVILQYTKPRALSYFPKLRHYLFFNKTKLWNDHFFLYLEGEVALGYVAEYSHDSGSEHLGRRWEPAAPLYKYLEEDIIEQDAHADQQRIAKQLDTAMYIGLGKHNVLGKYKPYREADRKRNQERSNVRRYGKPCYIYRLLVKHKIVTDEIDKDIQNSIGAPTGQVAECLVIDPTGKGLMKKINDAQDYISSN